MNTISKLKKKTKGIMSQNCRVIALILCKPSDIASYLFKDYENFFDSSKLYWLATSGGCFL